MESGCICVTGNGLEEGTGTDILTTWIYVRFKQAILRKILYILK